MLNVRAIAATEPECLISLDAITLWAALIFYGLSLSESHAPQQVCITWIVSEGVVIRKKGN